MVAPAESNADIPPSDEESETKLLACVVADPATALARAKGIQVQHFDNVFNRQLFTAALVANAKYERRCDALSLLEHVQTSGLLEGVGGKSRLELLCSLGANPALADLYAKRLLDLHGKRAYWYAAKEVTEASQNGKARDDLRLTWKRLTQTLDAQDTGDDDGWGELDGDTLRQEPDEDLVHFWPGLVVAEHVLLFSGTAKTGKSWLLYGFLGALSRCDPWLGNKAGPDPVWSYIVSEEPKSRVKAKLNRFGVGGAKILARGGIKASASWPETVEKAAKNAQKHRCGVLFFDTLGGLSQMEKENDNAEANRALHPILQVAGRYGLAVIVTHHAPNALRRSSQRPQRMLRAVDFVRGAGALAANPDALAGIDNDDNPDGPRRLLVAEGRFDVPALRQIIEYRAPVDGKPATYDVVGRPAEVAAQEETRERLDTEIKLHGRILAKLVKYPGLSSSQLAEAMGTNPGHLRMTLFRMVEAEKIRREKSGSRSGSFVYFVNTK